MDQESSLACDGVVFHYPDTKEPALHEPDVLHPRRQQDGGARS